MRYPTIEEYLFYLRMNDNILSLTDMIEYTMFPEIQEEDACRYVLNALTQLQQGGYVQIHMPFEEDEDIAVILTEKGEKLADVAAEITIEKSVKVWNEHFALQKIS